MNYTSELTNLKIHASRAHADYPQYRGHFANWILGVITQPYRGKGGSTFSPGDKVLFNPIPRQSDDSAPTYSVYCPATTHNCAVEMHKIRPVVRKI